MAANKVDVAIVGTEIVGLEHAYFAARFGRSVTGSLHNNHCWTRNERYVSGGILISLGLDRPERCETRI